MLQGSSYFNVALLTIARSYRKGRARLVVAVIDIYTYMCVCVCVCVRACVNCTNLLLTVVNFLRCSSMFMLEPAVNSFQLE